MDGFTPPILVELIKTLGLGMVFLLFWYWDSRKQDRRMEQFHDFMREQKAMYENNVLLVKSTQDIAKTMEARLERDQQLVALNAERYAELCVLVKTSQFCPLVRDASGDGGKK